jgi:hexulose-6-phosphate isomerase
MDGEGVVNPIGFMQGRLSPQVDGRIQAFPWEHWRAEFPLAQRGGFDRMEWTLDARRLDENPVMTPAGRAEIRALEAAHGVRVTALTADFFMQEPFFRAEGPERSRRLDVLARVLDSCADLAVAWVVCPLVDHGRLETESQEAAAIEGLVSVMAGARGGAGIAIESDYPPARLAAMFRSLPAPTFGVNYDIGNSASLGFAPAEELAAYGDRIVHVHVKDRLVGGTTVPLGTGSADFPAAFGELRLAGYSGELILQTARAADGDHAGALARYKAAVERWVREARNGA